MRFPTNNPSPVRALFYLVIIIICITAIFLTIIPQSSLPSPTLAFSPLSSINPTINAHINTSYLVDSHITNQPNDSVSNHTTSKTLSPKESHYVNPKKSRIEKIEAILGRVRSSIKEAARVKNLTSVHKDTYYVPQGPIYRNPNAFHRYISIKNHHFFYVIVEV